MGGNWVRDSKRLIPIEGVERKLEKNWRQIQKNKSKKNYEESNRNHPTPLLLSPFVSINPFLANVPILYPLKTPENLWFSGVFRRYKMGTLVRNELNEMKCGSSTSTFIFFVSVIWSSLHIVPEPSMKIHTDVATLLQVCQGNNKM